jgi:hypothetical protein
MLTTLPVLAGMVSTAIFAASTLPMLRKAARTRELSSYSAGNIGLANAGNAVHSIYVFHLPPGPIWLLHIFYLVSSALMLYWYVRFGRPESSNSPSHRPERRVALQAQPHPW